MSEIAVRERTARQRWAMPGSRHDRLVGITHWLLPVLIGVLAAFLPKIETAPRPAIAR